MTVAIVLGYKLNKDATMDEILIKRLDLCLKLLNEEKIDRVILSGGKPTPPGLNYSETEAMEKYLLEKGVNPSILIKEDQSLTTVENAKYSVPIAKSLNANKIIVITTLEHMGRSFLNPINIFADQVKDNNISLMFYTNSINK